MLASEWPLAIVDICLIASLNMCGEGAASVVGAVLDGGCAESLIAMTGEFMTAAVLVDDRGTELLIAVFTGWDTIGGISRSVLLVHVEAASAIAAV
jgi:hypothetical protein